METEKLEREKKLAKELANQAGRMSQVYIMENGCIFTRLDIDPKYTGEQIDNIRIESVYHFHPETGINAAPFSAMRAAEDALTWVETNHYFYWDMLGCVPPIRQSGSAFMVGECDHYNYERGNMYATFTQVNGRFFCKMDSTRNFDPAVYRLEIEKQFGL